jgi:hypothetical protein
MQPLFSSYFFSILAGSPSQRCPDLFMLLLAYRVIPLGLFELLDVFRCQLRPVDGQRHLVQLAGEFEWYLVPLSFMSAPVSS